MSLTEEEVQSRLSSLYTTGLNEVELPIKYLAPNRWSYGEPVWNSADMRHWQNSINHDRAYINELYELILDLREEVEELREELHDYRNR